MSPVMSWTILSSHFLRRTEPSADDAPGEQVDDDRQIEPALAGPDVGDVGAPLLVRHGRCEVLVQKVRGDRKGVKAVGGALKPPLLPSPEPILAHQPGDASAADGKPIVAKFVHHARAAVGPVRKGEGRADMSQQHHVLALAATGRTTLPGEVAARADAEDLA